MPLEAGVGESFELDDELKEYLEVDSSLGVLLRHPLIYHVPFFSGMEGLANRQLEAKKARIKRLVAEGDYRGVIVLHERPYRLACFLEHRHSMTSEDYWSTLAWIWADSENIPQNWGAWLMLLTSDRRGREFFMSSNDWMAFYQLDDEITVYQGVSETLGDTHAEYGSEEISWSTSEKVAQFFAGRFNGSGEITSKVVKKAEIFAYLTERGEEEIMLLPDQAPAITLQPQDDRGLL